MDPNIIITIAGVIGGSVAGAISTYLVQKRVSERQRKWSLEDEDRNRQHELKGEHRRIKRELSSKRLDVVEETIKLKMRIISRAVGKEMGLPMYDDKDTIVAIGKRIQDISGEAWASILATGSKDLREYWKQISNAYWALKEEGTVGHELWNQAQKAYVEIFKLIDEMKSKS